MSIDFTNYQGLVNNFNQRYGVRFNYEDFENEVALNKSLDDNYEPKGSELSEENKKYITDFAELFDKAFVNSLARKIDPFTHEEGR